MLDFTQKYKGLNIYFATIEPDSEAGHYIYLSAYGHVAAELLDKYVENQRADNEERFTKWDELIELAKTKNGLRVSDEIEEGYIYISTFQSGVGISLEDEEGRKRLTTRGKRGKTKISIINPDMTKGMDDDDDDDNVKINLGNSIDEIENDDE